MTIPTELNLPAVTTEVTKNPAKMMMYLKDLTYDLEKMYSQVQQNVNGSITADFSIGQQQYKPAIVSSDMSTPGVGTYDHQIGWVLRKGIIVDVWFDVQWTAHTGTTGVPMYVTLPYLVAISDKKPFVGTLYASNITYSGDYLTCNAEPNTRKCNVWDTDSATPGAQVNLDTAGQLVGHIRYIGQEIERT